MTFWTSPYLKRFHGLMLCSLFLCCAGNANENAAGPMGLYSLIYRHPVEARLKWGVLGTDFWRPSDSDSKQFSEFTEFPIYRPLIHRTKIFLLQNAHFTPDVYLAKIQELSLRPGGCDVLFYYGGDRKPGMEPHGLNFNAWSPEQLQRLRMIGGRPFIGLETMDEKLVGNLLAEIESGGYGHGDTMYIRIGAEPSTMAYGTFDGMGHGLRHTSETYAAYQKRFMQTSAQLRAWGRLHDVHFKIVFTGDSPEDFDHYAPPRKTFDAIGYDLYVTPANLRKVLPLLKHISKRFADKPMVIPEFGIATGGGIQDPPQWAVRATPQWGQAVLGKVLEILARHPSGLTQMTVFSVNVAARIESRHWNWAWTREMFDELAEWRESPRTWRPEGFHRYDPSSFPLGQNILLDRRPGLKLYYRRLNSTNPNGLPLFLETAFVLDHNTWTRLERAVTFNNGEVIELRPQ